MTTVEKNIRILPGSSQWDELLGSIAAGTKDRDLHDENPFDQVAALKRAGFGTLRLPRELGGSGLTVPQLFSAVIDAAEADPIVAPFFRTHFWFTEERLRTATDPASLQWLRKVADGKLFGNAFSEKGANAVGSLVFNTRLLPDPAGGFRLEGEKFYSTGTLFSDYLTVTATTDHDSVATIVVPADRTGVKLVDDWDGFGQRAPARERRCSRTCARGTAASATLPPNDRPTTRFYSVYSASWPARPTSRRRRCSMPRKRLPGRPARTPRHPTAARIPVWPRRSS